jgi:hypothetical protein
VIFGKENPMADLLSMTAMDPFGRANVVFDWEKHYWEVSESWSLDNA